MAKCEHLLWKLDKWIIIVLFFQLFYILGNFRLKSQHKRQKLSMISIVRWGSWLRLHVVRKHRYLKILDSSSARKMLALYEVLGDPRTKDQHIWVSHMTLACRLIFTYHSDRPGSTCRLQIATFSLCNLFCLAGIVDCYEFNTCTVQLQCDLFLETAQCCVYIMW